ncbi:MAG: LysR family transcriptional regulator [Gammaproteobacteria bacterium]|nr:LysR family transcriptional regulator [Gammaproteobacteria bacterium]
MQWNDLTVVLAICRAGTLSGAARALNLNHSTVFRRLNAIEEKMGVRFFERLQQGYVMTEAGEAAMRAAERIDEEVLGLSRELVGKDLRLQGSIRVTAPEGLSIHFLGTHIGQFCRLHPDIHVDLVVTSSDLRLSRREADLAVRVTSHPPDTSLGRHICRFRFCMYASRAYLKKNFHGKLEDYDWLMPDDGIDWLPASIWRKELRPQARVVMSSDNTLVLVNAAKNDLGVIPLPCFWGDSEKKLVRVIDPPDELTLDLWLLTHQDLRHTARVRALMTFLHEALQQQKDLIEGVPGK